MQQDTFNRIKSHPTEWERIFENHTLDRELISRIYKELLKLNNNKKQITQFKNGQRTWIDISPKKTHKWPISAWKRCSASLIIREMQIKTTMKCHLMPIRIDTIKTNKQTNRKQQVLARIFWTLDPLCTAGWECKM